MHLTHASVREVLAGRAGLDLRRRRASQRPGTDDLEDAGGNTFNGALEVENFEG
jgi:hypothetical protein